MGGGRPSFGVEGSDEATIPLVQLLPDLYGDSALDVLIYFEEDYYRRHLGHRLPPTANARRSEAKANLKMGERLAQSA
jgi:hypothetical protein